jgi:hypothetical protein
MASVYQKKNYAALTLALVVLGLMIACITVPWYHWSGTFTRKFDSGSTATGSTLLNSTVFVYDLIGVRDTRTENYISADQSLARAGSREHYYTHDIKVSHTYVQSTFRVSKAFVLITLILSFVLAAILAVFSVELIRNKAIFLLGMTLTRAFLLVVCLLLIASATISCLGFLAISNNFKKDQQIICTTGPCLSFAGAVKSHFDNGSVTLVTAWGPDAGWYISLAAIPISLLLTFIVAVNRFPLPIDSEASSGEAL